MGELGLNPKTKHVAGVDFKSVRLCPPKCFRLWALRFVGGGVCLSRPRKEKVARGKFFLLHEQFRPPEKCLGPNTHSRLVEKESGEHVPRNCKLGF